MRELLLVGKRWTWFLSITHLRLVVIKNWKKFLMNWRRTYYEMHWFNVNGQSKTTTLICKQIFLIILVHWEEKLRVESFFSPLSLAEIKHFLCDHCHYCPQYIPDCFAWLEKRFFYLQMLWKNIIRIRAASAASKFEWLLAIETICKQTTYLIIFFFDRENKRIFSTYMFTNFVILVKEMKDSFSLAPILGPDHPG